MKTDPQYQQRRCSQMTLVSHNIEYKLYVDIHWEFTGQEA